MGDEWDGVERRKDDERFKDLQRQMDERFKGLNAKVEHGLQGVRDDIKAIKETGETNTKAIQQGNEANDRLEAGLLYVIEMIRAFNKAASVIGWCGRVIYKCSRWLAPVGASVAMLYGLWHWWINGRP